MSDSQCSNGVFDQRAMKTKARRSDNDTSFTVWGVKARGAGGTSGFSYAEGFPESNDLLSFADISSGSCLEDENEPQVNWLYVFDPAPNDFLSKRVHTQKLDFDAPS